MIWYWLEREVRKVVQRSGVWRLGDRDRKGVWDRGFDALDLDWRDEVWRVGETWEMGVFFGVQAGLVIVEKGLR